MIATNSCHPRIKLLFVAENITLAQVTRLVTLAASLSPEKYEIHFACSSFPPMIFGGLDFERHLIKSVSQNDVLCALKKGEWVYSTQVLEAYMQEELSLLDKVRPDLVIGDFRLSLPVSTAVKAVPFINLINAYWSPHAVRRNEPLPEHPIVNRVGPTLARIFYPLACPVVFRRFARPVNSLRRKYGLASTGSLREVLTSGDYVIYPDMAQLISMKFLPENHFFIGPVLWSPAGEAVEDFIPSSGIPLVYATLGSSGAAEKLSFVADALKESGMNAVIATAGRCDNVRSAKNMVVKDFLPGSFYCRHASAVISNGGSSTGYQALAEGAPVLGIPSNLDQYLCMQHIEEAGAGISLRSDRLKKTEVSEALYRLLNDRRYRNNAEKIRKEAGSYDTMALFQKVLDHAHSNGKTTG